MKKNNYLVSGIEPGPGGVGALMQELIPIAQRYGFQVITNWSRPSIRKLLSQGRFFKVAKVLGISLVRRAQFFLITNSIKGGNVIFVHPQTAGFSTLFRLAQKNQLFLYVMDNSFFCMRSYNFHPVHRTECLKCIGNAWNADAECTPFPVLMETNKNTAFLEHLRKIAHQITFLCQNKNQSQLLKRHFGSDIRTIVIGMNTGELRDWSPEVLERSAKIDHKPFILFHGAAVDPKGLDYVVRLAEKMPHQKFIFPCPKSQIRDRSVPKNVECIDVNWSNGLRKLTQTAELVINPSMWSAPIEAALVKSLAYNPKVATVQTKFGFENEIPDEVGLLRLPQDTDEAADLLEKFLEAEKESNLSLQPRVKWVKKMKASNRFERFISNLQRKGS